MICVLPPGTCSAHDISYSAVSVYHVRSRNTMVKLWACWKLRNWIEIFTQQRYLNIASAHDGRPTGILKILRWGCQTMQIWPWLLSDWIRTSEKIIVQQLCDVRIRSKRQFDCNSQVTGCSISYGGIHWGTNNESTIMKADNLEFTGESHFFADWCGQYNPL